LRSLLGPNKCVVTPALILKKYENEQFFLFSMDHNMVLSYDYAKQKGGGDKRMHLHHWPF
jgi:hypothetical protein